ncbi:hypothetical protein [Weissella ceti]|uniref:Putative phage tail protein n=1 Tax=Weissella ceti TaxID=759620 RepID=A0A088GGF7_9LACO|nr:hypothetical protein [Weissella ceti]AIM63061.1 Putative phage tail protein [Weissella ceti]
MNYGDFEINGFVGSKNKMMLMHRIDTKIPERNLSFNDGISGIDGAVVFDERNYKNRVFEISILIQAKTYDERVSLYTKFMKALDIGRYVPAIFYSDENYEYRIIRTSEVKTGKPGFFDEMETLTFTVSAEPYKFVRNQNSVNVPKDQEIEVINPTEFVAKPYLKITGTGSITVTINGTAYRFMDVKDSIEIDSALQSVYRMDAGKLLMKTPRWLLVHSLN